MRNQTIVSSIGEDPRLAKISGYGNKLYISYKEDEYIYTKRSTNAGQSWSNMETIEMDYDESNGLELWSDADALHITWSEYDNTEYDTYHNKLEHNDNEWSTKKRLTDSSGDNGGFPSVTTSTSRVHVAYTQGDELVPTSNDETSKTRDQYSATWQTSQTTFTSTMRSSIIANSSKLHCFYYEFVEGWGQWHGDLYYKNRNLSSTTWSTATLIQDFSSPGNNLVDMALSSDDKIHVVYDYSGAIRYKNWDDGTWSGYTTLADDYEMEQKICANGNDIYVIWIDDDDKIRLKQLDDSPLVPELTLDASGDHPVLSWNKTNADAKQYKIFRKSGVYGNFVHIATTTTNLSWIDNNVDFSKPDTHYWYKIKAVDYSDNESDFSNTVDVWGMHKRSFKNPIISLSSKPENFELRQNYPNPFNPSTTISFSLPKASHVILKIYDVHGNLVSNLLDVYKNAGIYKVEFFASKLPSGIYFYYLNTDGFKATKRMLLVK